jgi:hypothetical protein
MIAMMVCVEDRLERHLFLFDPAQNGLRFGWIDNGGLPGFFAD